MYQDLSGLLALYTHLHDNVLPKTNDALMYLWTAILHDPNHHIFVAIFDDRIVSSCVFLLVPNLTHGQRPYALIENVVTHSDYRKRGYATQVLSYAKALAVQQNCYKIMLMTGAKDSDIHRFYERAGYNSSDKTAFIQWL